MFISQAAIAYNVISVKPKEIDDWDTISIARRKGKGKQTNNIRDCQYFSLELESLINSRRN